MDSLPKNRIGAEINVGPWITTEGKFTVFNATIDGVNTGEHFVVDNFLASSKKEGLQYLLQGDCDVAPCCGYFIQVHHEKDKVVWKSSYRAANETEADMETEIKELTLYGGKKMSFPLSFDRTEYELLGEKLAKLEKIDTTK